MKKTGILNYERIRFLRLLFEGYLQFGEQYRLYKNEGKLPRARIIEGICKNIFNELKTCAHVTIGPFSEADDSPWREYELLCDLVVGACYHEMQQLQENLYLVKLYRLRFEELRQKVTAQDLNEYFEVAQSLIDEAETQIPSNLDWIWKLILESMRLTKMILVSYANNRVLLRFMLQNPDLLAKVYEKDEIDEIFGKMFPNGIQEALWEGSKDLANSGHYHSMIDMLSRLIGIQKTSNACLISQDRIREALYGALGAARLNRDNELENRCQMLISQVGG